jgi:hypothetical protein
VAIGAIRPDYDAERVEVFAAKACSARVKAYVLGGCGILLFVKVTS